LTIQKVFDEFMCALKSYGDLSILSTRYFLEPLEIGEELSVDIEIGKTLFVKLLAVGPTDPISGRREVYFELNGEARVLSVTDKRTRRFLGIIHERIQLKVCLFPGIFSGREDSTAKGRPFQSRRSQRSDVWCGGRNPAQRYIGLGCND
jgi:hypothetical protein